MLRHAGISEIYTRGHSLLSLVPSLPSVERACLPVHNLRHVPSCLVSFVFYRLPFPFLSFSFALPPLSSRHQHDWVIQWFVLLITELRGRGTMVPSSRQEWNERRQLRISRKMKGRHLRAENTLVPGIVLRSFPVHCTRRATSLFPALSNTLVGKSQFSRRYRRAIYRRISFWRPRVVIVVIVVAPVSIFLIEEKYRILREAYYMKRIYCLPLHMHVKLLAKSFAHCSWFLSRGSDSTRN